MYKTLLSKKFFSHLHCFQVKLQWLYMRYFLLSLLDKVKERVVVVYQSLIERKARDNLHQ